MCTGKVTFDLTVQTQFLEGVEVMPDKILTNVPGMKNASAVPILDAGELSEVDFNSEYVANSRPCVIRGAVRHWAALEKWRDKEYLKSRSGQHEVNLFLSELHVTKKRMIGQQKALNFAEAIDYLHSEQTERGLVVTGILTEFLSDLGEVPFINRAESAFWYDPARYFFYRNAGSAWHHHPFDETLMCQIIGSKRIGLVSADQPLNFELRNIFFAEDYYDDPAAFAGFDSDKLQWFSAILEEGDALYIPPLWWHGVVPITTSFGITAPVTWRSPLHVIGKGITKIARGEIDMIGKTTAPNFEGLVEVARILGMERELAIAWDRGV
jgi:hypothetical protein